MEVNRFSEMYLMWAISIYSGNYIGGRIDFLNDARLRRRGELEAAGSNRASARTLGVRIWQRWFQHQHLCRGRAHRPPPNAHTETRLSATGGGAATGEVRRPTHSEREQGPHRRRTHEGYRRRGAPPIGQD